MIDPIGPKWIQMQPPQAPRDRATQFASSIETAEEEFSAKDCLISYFKRLGQNFVTMVGALWDLLQVIFCCKLHQEHDWKNGWKLPVGTANSIITTLDPLKESEMKNIYFVIHTISNNNLLNLLGLQEKLQAKGDAINHIHPFRFFEYALSHPQLKEDLKKLSDAFIPFVWDNFTGGLSKRFARAKETGDIARHLDGFSKKTGVAKEALEQLIEKEDWKAFIKLLVNQS